MLTDAELTQGTAVLWLIFATFFLAWVGYLFDDWMKGQRYPLALRLALCLIYASAVAAILSSATATYFPQQHPSEGDRHEPTGTARNAAEHPHSR